jgi:protein-S-isoprenylcysteine O-methyltransferase Ste14
MKEINMTNDLKEIWQMQPSEEYKVSLELIRLRSRQLAVKTRLQFLTVSGMSLGLILFDLWNFHVSPNALQRGGFLLAAGWAGAALIQAGQSIWPSSLAKDAEWVTCLAFSRFQLERQLNYSRHIWPGLVGAALATVAAIAAPGLELIYKRPEQFPKILPVLVVLAIWTVMFIVIKRRERQKLRQEMGELDSLSGEPVRGA